LRSVDYSDVDRIVTLLTGHFGKATFIARGAKRSKKRFGGALQPLCLLSVEVTEVGPKMGSLVQAQVTRSFPRILGDLLRMDAAFGALVLVRELLPEHEPDSVVFASICALLEALDQGQAVPERLRLCFELRLLSLLGFAPQLDRCGLCGKLARPGQAAELDPRLGHLTCRDCGGAAYRISGAMRVELMRALGPEWLRAAESTWPEQGLSEAREALARFVDHRFDIKKGAMR
jgi:DNA repair protein RecO (recombination protein O)